MVTVPVICFPIGLREMTRPSLAVRRAYAATFPDAGVVEQTQALVEEWALNVNTSGEVVTGGETEGGDGEQGDQGDQGDQADPNGDYVVPDGMIDVSNGGIANTSYVEGYTPVENTSYSDIPTYTIYQQYDEANLPIELLDVTVFTPDNTTEYVDAQDSILKEFPDMSSNTVGTLFVGQAVTRIGIGDTWSKVVTEDGVEGYVLSNSLSDEMVWQAIDRTVWVDADSLTLRAEPSTDSEVLATLPRDSRLHCTSVSAKWYEVTTEAGLTGYVYISYTTTNAPPTPTPTNPPRSSSGGRSGGSSGGSYSGSTGNTATLPVITGVNGESIVNICVSMLGVDYVWAGESSSGVDCSGLVVYAYRQIGISVPHLAQSITTCGVSVSRSDIMPGDVVCWDTGGGYCGHVGIYVGGGQVIHASNSRDNVCYGSVDMMSILTIRRFIQ